MIDVTVGASNSGSSSEASSSKPFWGVVPEAALVYAAIFFLAAIVVIVDNIIIIRRRKSISVVSIPTESAVYQKKASNLNNVFRWLLVAALLCRSCWCITEHVFGKRDLSIFINRICLVLFLVLFGLLLIIAAETRGTTASLTPAALSGALGVKFLSSKAISIFCAFFIPVCCVSFISAIIDCSVRVGTSRITVAYDISVVSMAVCFLVYAALAVVLAFRITATLRETTTATSVVAKVCIYCVLLAVCFLDRAIFLTWRILFNYYFPGVIFLTFAYVLPEIIPTILFLWITHADLSKTESSSWRDISTPGAGKNFSWNSSVFHNARFYVGALGEDEDDDEDMCSEHSVLIEDAKSPGVTVPEPKSSWSYAPATPEPQNAKGKSPSKAWTPKEAAERAYVANLIGSDTETDDDSEDEYRHDEFSGSVKF